MSIMAVRALRCRAQRFVLAAVGLTCGVGLSDAAAAAVTIDVPCQQADPLFEARVRVTYNLVPDPLFLTRGGASLSFAWNAVEGATSYSIGQPFPGGWSGTATSAQFGSLAGFGVGCPPPPITCLPQLFPSIEASVAGVSGVVVSANTGQTSTPCDGPAFLPPMCGNLSVEDGEECDDGNFVEMDGCSSACVIQVCGDGINQGEDCDDGNVLPGDGCGATCRSECGDGTLDREAAEECDDGNRRNGDGCTSTCHATGRRLFGVILGVNDGTHHRGDRAARAVFDALRVLPEWAGPEHGNPQSPFELAPGVNGGEALVREALDAMPVRPGDTVVVYFAAHGGSNAARTEFHLVAGGDSADGQSRVDDVDLRAMFADPKWHGVNKLFLLESCRSAGFVDQLGDLDKAVVLASAERDALATVAPNGVGTWTNEVLPLIGLQVRLTEIVDFLGLSRSRLLGEKSGTTVPVITLPGDIGPFAFDPFAFASADAQTDAVFGLPTCRNGVDDDGDGAVDFPADTGCASADDGLEWALDENAVVRAVAVPMDSQDGASGPRDADLWSIATPPLPLDVTRGIGLILAPPGGSAFSLHDHVYAAPHVPEPSRAVVTYAFERPQVVRQLEIIQHQNGVTEVEGFAGESVGTLQSIGRVFGPRGDVTGGSVFNDGDSYVFEFGNQVPASLFRFVIRKTSLRDGYALFRAFPRDPQGIRLTGAAATECNDLVDNDGDGAIDIGGDPSCVNDADDTEGGAPEATPTPAATATPTQGPACGDGALDVGEECDDGNVDRDDGCSEDCRIELCFACVSEPSLCQSLPDEDQDGVCDAEDPCTNREGGQTFLASRRSTLTVRRGATRALQKSALQLAGFFGLPPPQSFSSLQPDRAGMALAILRSDGHTLLKVQLPPGEFAGRGSRGWRRNRKGTKLDYTDRTGEPVGGIQSVRLSVRNTGGRDPIAVKIIGHDASYAALLAGSPHGAVLTFGAQAEATAGLCAETAFSAADCAPNGKGTTFICKR